MSGANSSECRTSRCWNGDPAQVNAALVGPQKGGQTTSNESLGSEGNKRPRTVDFVTPYKRTMPSSGLQSVEVDDDECY
ncbi:jg10409 [Pararge aegeria aegeria]|uniref:Jg10409 protein n=1 Tax=Pararge aegeria aegeria TaxID=348720 RepID=A0A8S4RPX1_9NEOP|nr:jg10409 [Pararge aegeria aegeria]